jgi:hypothetical protein
VSAHDVPEHALLMSAQRHGQPSTLNDLLKALRAELDTWHGVCDQANTLGSALSAARADSVRGALHAFGAIVANTEAALGREADAEAAAFQGSWDAPFKSDSFATAPTLGTLRKVCGVASTSADDDVLHCQRDAGHDGQHAANVEHVETERVTWSA